MPPYLPRTDLVLRDVRRVYSNLKLLDERVGGVLEQLEADALLEETIVVFYADHGGPLPGRSASSTTPACMCRS